MWKETTAFKWDNCEIQMQTELDFKLLKEEIRLYKPLLARVADTIMDENVSSYPIFVLHREAIEVGIPLSTEKIKGQWGVNASSLEEFVAKQLVLPEKVNDFKSVFKDPAEFLCLFVTDKSGATFVFVPRQG